MSDTSKPPFKVGDKVEYIHNTADIDGYDHDKVYIVTRCYQVDNSNSWFVETTHTSSNRYTYKFKLCKNVNILNIINNL